jgi:hypothetical protein
VVLRCGGRWEVGVGDVEETILKSKRARSSPATTGIRIPDPGLTREGPFFQPIRLSVFSDQDCGELAEGSAGS